MKKYKIEIEANVSGSDDLEKLDKSLESIADNAKSAQSGITALDTTLDSVASSADEASSSLGDASDSVSELADNADGASDAIGELGTVSKESGATTSEATSNMGAGFERVQDQAQLAATGLRNIQQEARATQAGVRASAGDAAGALTGVGTTAKEVGEEITLAFDGSSTSLRAIGKEATEAETEIINLWKKGTIDAELALASLRNIERSYTNISNAPDLFTQPDVGSYEKQREELAKAEGVTVRYKDAVEELGRAQQDIVELNEDLISTEEQLAVATEKSSEAYSDFFTSFKQSRELIEAGNFEEGHKVINEATQELKSADQVVSLLTQRHDRLNKSLDDTNTKMPTLNRRVKGAAKELKGMGTLTSQADKAFTSMGKSITNVGASIAGAFGGAAFALVNRIVDAFINMKPVADKMEEIFSKIEVVVDSLIGKYDDLAEAVTGNSAALLDWSETMAIAEKALLDLDEAMVMNRLRATQLTETQEELIHTAELAKGVWEDEERMMSVRNDALVEWKGAMIGAIHIRQLGIDADRKALELELTLTGQMGRRKELLFLIAAEEERVQKTGYSGPNSYLESMQRELQEINIITGPIIEKLQSLGNEGRQLARDLETVLNTFFKVKGEDDVADQLGDDLSAFRKYLLDTVLAQEGFNETINLRNATTELEALEIRKEFLKRRADLTRAYLNTEIDELKKKDGDHSEEIQKLYNDILALDRAYTVEYLGILDEQYLAEKELKDKGLEDDKKRLEEQKRLAQEEFDYRRMLFGEMINLMGEIGLERIGIFADMMDILWVEAVEDGVSSIMKLTELSTAEVGALIGTAFRGVAQLMNFIADAYDESTREGFEKQKKARIGGAIMDSLGAAIAGLLAGLEAGGPWGIALGIATAASSLAFGLTQVDKIKKTTFDGGGDSGGGGIGPQSSIISPYEDGGKKSSPADPNVLKQGAGNLPPVQAQVVGETVTTQQAIERQTTKNASF